MPKNIEDIVTTSDRKRSIRNIPIPENRRRSTASARTKERVGNDVFREPTRTSRIRPTEYESPKTVKKRRIPGRMALLALGVALIVLIFGAMAVFDGATLAYTPKSAAISLSEESFSAHKTAESDLLFSVVKLSGDKGVSVSASGEELVERKASGTIIVYNNVGREPQRLIEETRFETPDGKIYRIAQAISIPGQRMVAGALQPGSIEAVVYAAEPGEEGNIGLTDWTVPGLKGTPRFNTVYARSKTPMSGGYVGKEKKVSDEDLLRVKGELQIALKTELAEQARAQVPEEFILIPTLSSTTYEDLPQTDVASSKVTVNVRGSFYAVMFKRADLAARLASKSITLVPGEVVLIPNFESLEFSFSNTAPADLLSSSQIDFKVDGSTNLMWRTDENALKRDLAGRRKSEVNAILNNYPSVAEAEATVRPFWKSAFPEDADKITIQKK
ncbi:MAG: hypothetical protein Q8O98_01825 [bacterium]|nr:hypothetical protein [bacterium]